MESNGTPKYQVELKDIVRSGIRELTTCLEVDGVWYAAVLTGDGRKEWERAGYIHPTLPPRSEASNLAEAWDRLGADKSPAWRQLATLTRTG